MQDSKNRAQRNSRIDEFSERSVTLSKYDRY